MTSRGFPADVFQQAALTARYKKENDAQLKWYVMQKEAGIDPGAVKSKQAEVLKGRLNAPVINSRMKKRLELYKPPRHNIKTINFEDEILRKLNLKCLGDFREMRPPSPKTEDILYDGLTKEGKGRGKYLRMRNKVNPDNKFEFPVLSSMEYGWKVDDIMKKDGNKKPIHSRIQIISHTFYRHNGVSMKHNDDMLVKNKTVF